MSLNGQENEIAKDKAVSKAEWMLFWAGSLGFVAFIVNLFFVEKTKAFFLGYLGYVPPSTPDNFGMNDVIYGLMGLMGGFMLPSMILMTPFMFAYIFFKEQENAKKPKSVKAQKISIFPIVADAALKGAATGVIVMAMVISAYYLFA